MVVERGGQEGKEGDFCHRHLFKLHLSPELEESAVEFVKGGTDQPS